MRRSRSEPRTTRGFSSALWHMRPASDPSRLRFAKRLRMRAGQLQLSVWLKTGVVRRRRPDETIAPPDEIISPHNEGGAKRSSPRTGITQEPIAGFGRTEDVSLEQDAGRRRAGGRG